MPQNLPDQQRILDILQDFHGIEPLKELFWGELNYDRQNDPIDRGDWNQRDISNTADDPLLFATGGDDFHLIYTRLNSDRLRLTDERPIILLVCSMTTPMPYSSSATAIKLTGTSSMPNSTRRARRHAANAVYFAASQ